MSGRRSLKLDPVTRELVFEAGRLVWLTDLAAIKQSAEIRLRFLLGEWFLDLDAGVDWLGKVLGKRYDPDVARALVSKALLETPGILAVLSLEPSFDSKTRTLTVSWVTSTDFGELTGTTPVAAP